VQKELRLPLLNNVVRATATPYQSGLDAAERRRNLRSVFCVRGCITASHVLIIDDVITTGETCRQLARVLLDGGVTKVSVLAIARASKQSSYTDGLKL
jgi:predicted amidophosphoribosyltransferase